jgi:hypothetical protein
MMPTKRVEAGMTYGTSSLLGPHRLHDCGTRILEYDGVVSVKDATSVLARSRDHRNSS